ncbi:MAG: NFACT RNA binding domain-containing protein [archaeon]
MKKTNLRKVTTKKGTLILAGRDEDSNESLIEQAKEDEDVFHTEKPGSPFVNIKGKPKAGDRKFAALICARYSHDWRDNKKDVIVHRFKGKDIYKTKGMKKGTFGVKKFKAIKIKKREIEEFG